MKSNGMSFGDMMLVIMLTTAASIGNSLYTDRKVKPLLEYQQVQDRFTEALKENVDAHVKFFGQELEILNKDINFLKWKMMDKTFLDAGPQPTHSVTNAYTGTINIHGKEYHIVNGVLMEAQL